MAGPDLFYESDEAGFSGLLDSEFVQYRDMIFRKSVLNRAEIDEAIAKGTPGFLIQHQANHESMIAYGARIETQRQHGQQLQRVWLVKLQEAFPTFYSWVILEDSAAEVVITLRASLISK